MMQCNSNSLCCVALLVAVLCLHGQQAEAQPRGGRVRGEETNDNRDNLTNGRRKLFADMWGDPNKPGRGGAGAAAKGLDEFVGMRDRVTTAPAPTVTAATPNPTNRPATAPPVPVDTTRNDRCTNAKGPIAITAQGLGNSRAIIYEDTTVGARIPIVTPDRCNRITNSGPGVWYKVVGTGELMVR